VRADVRLPLVGLGRAEPGAGRRGARGRGLLA
jgi:hypothetical protein